MSGQSSRRMFSFLGSGRFLVLMVAGWVVYYVTMTVWSKEAFSTFMTSVEKNVLVQLLTLVFMASLVVNLTRTAFRIASEHRWLVSLWVVLPLGLFVFLSGFFMNAVFKSEGNIIVQRGDRIQPPWEEKPFLLSSIEPGLRDELLGGEDPGGTGSPLFLYEPSITLRSQTDEYRVGIYPPAKIGGTYYHILDFGLAPGYRLIRDGRTVQEAHVVQRLLPPGSNDAFLLDPFPYRMDLRLAPSRVMKKGRTEMPIYNLKDLRYQVEVRKGEELLFEGLSFDRMEFDGMRIEFTPHAYWVRLEAARRPGMALMVTGLALILAGIPLWVLYVILRLIRQSASLQQLEMENPSD